METIKKEIGGREYTIGRFTLKQKGQIYDRSHKIDAMGRMTEYSTEKHMVMSLVFGVVNPKLTEEEAGNLDGAVGEALYREVLEFNTLPLPTKPTSPRQ